MLSDNNIPSVRVYDTVSNYTNYSTDEASENKQSTDQQKTLNKSQTVGNQILVEKERVYETDRVYETERVYETDSGEEGGNVEGGNAATQTSPQVHHYSTTSSSLSAPPVALSVMTNQDVIIELAKQVKIASEVLQEPLPTLHLPEQAGRYQDLTDQVKDQLGYTYESTMKYIQEMGPAFIALAQQKQADQAIELGGKTLLFTQKGKVFVETRELGTGQFNKTIEVVLVASTKLASIQQDQAKLRAFRLTKLSTDPKTAQLDKEEREINLYIKEQAEQSLALGLDLSHVHIAKRITDVNTGQMGVMSTVQQGNINQLISTTNLNWGNKLDKATQMAQGVEQLHSIGIVHRDLKLDNFLYDGNHFVKISDFGLSSRQDPTHRSTNTQGVVWHMDPAWKGTKVEDDIRFSTESDVYQLGITFTQFLSNETYNIKDWTNLQIAESKVIRDEIDASSPPPIPESLATPEAPEAQTPEAVAEAAKKAAEEATRRARYLWKMNPDKWQALAEIPDPNVRNMVRRMVDPDPATRPPITEVVNFLIAQGLVQT